MKNKNYTLHPVETYNLVMKIRKEKKCGVKKIKRYLNNFGIDIVDGTIKGWIYRNKKPFVLKIIKQISKNSKKLTQEKAYILGTLCGDGYVSTDYRIGLSVCDKEFADYFQHCLEKIYGIKCSRTVRKIKYTPFCENPKPQYIVSLVSKLVVKDLQRYSESFKTKEWKVPIQIRESPKEIQAGFIKGLADSEGSARYRKGHSEVSICSGNVFSLKIIKNLLRDTFDITSYFGDNGNGVSVIGIGNYISLEKFYNEIGFIIKRKQDNLRKSLLSYKRKGIRRYSENFKFQAMDLLNQGFKHREIAKLLETSHSNIYDWEKSHFQKFLP
ncbi:MAG: hypothetical protein KAT77_02070 [Nanoarchaeota archaeon]|nr:hypothetical protein [Nanoarchaeota archaeon]